MILVDSLEKKWGHIETYFKFHGVEYSVQRLKTGDYQNTDNERITIDRKNGLQELCSNLSAGKNNHRRFYAECKRAFDDGQRFIVLIEGTNCKTVADVCKWKSKYSNHTGHWLQQEMFRLTVAYGVEWKFCTKRRTPSLILELLNYDKR